MGEMISSNWIAIADVFKYFGDSVLSQSDAVALTRRHLPPLKYNLNVCDDEIWSVIEFWSLVGRIFVHESQVVRDPSTLIALLKPLLHHVVSSGAYHAYANQTLKGEIATGAHMDPWPNYTNQSTAHYIKHQAEAIGEMLPCLRGVKFMRIWGGLADMTPDMAPGLADTLSRTPAAPAA
jgi:hypothetical protein